MYFRLTIEKRKKETQYFRLKVPFGLNYEGASWRHPRLVKFASEKKNISSAPLVTNHFYSYSLHNITSIKHGKTNEAIAIRQLQEQEKIVINKCGLFIDEDFFFLGASSDGTFEQGIIEIKCPISAFGMNAEEAIKRKKKKILEHRWDCQPS